MIIENELKESKKKLEKEVKELKESFSEIFKTNVCDNFLFDSNEWRREREGKMKKEEKLVECMTSKK